MNNKVNDILHQIQSNEQLVVTLQLKQWMAKVIHCKRPNKF